MSTVAPYARAAYALGWAAVDDPDTFPVGPAGVAGSKAAIALAETAPERPDLITVLVEAGRADAARVALHRARLRLYRKHRALIIAAAAGLHQALDRRLLTRNLVLTADQPRKVRQAQAARTIATALTAAPGVAGAWQQANQTAATAAAARGRSEAANTPPGGGPPDPRKVTAGLTAAAAALGTITAGQDWTGPQIEREAWNLSGLDLAGADDPEQAVSDLLDALDGVGAAAEDQMHAALSGAFADYFTAGPGLTLGQIAWVTEEDDRVCPACDANEENGPYPPDGLPEMPAHPNCRCWFELA